MVVVTFHRRYIFMNSPGYFFFISSKYFKICEFCSLINLFSTLILSKSSLINVTFSSRFFTFIFNTSFSLFKISFSFVNFATSLSKSGTFFCILFFVLLLHDLYLLHVYLHLLHPSHQKYVIQPHSRIFFNYFTNFNSGICPC